MVVQAVSQKSIPHRIYWELTRGCNLRCLHCRANPTELAASDDLSTQNCLQIMDQIAEVCRPALVLTGGEPLLRSDLYELARYGKSKGFHMGLATNGTLVTASVAEAIRDAGMGRIGISIDGADAATHDSFRRVPGAFDGATAGIRNLKRLGLFVQINTSVTTQNAAQLEAMLDLMTGLEVDAWHLFLLVPVGCGLQIAPTMQVEAVEYERILNWIYEKSKTATIDLRAVCAPHFVRIRAQHIMEDKSRGIEPQPFIAPGTKAKTDAPAHSAKGCLAGTGMCFISHRGEVYPCGYLPVQAGDLKKQAFGTIWADSPVLQDLRDPNLLKGKCGICEFRHICEGCRARAYGMTGDYLAEEPFCIYNPLFPSALPTARIPEEGHG
ncbi:MAG: radical SAM protein [Nitrospirae bacterium]|nr:radical SAM protein [Nitrospirota bacterium]